MIISSSSGPLLVVVAVVVVVVVVAPNTQQSSRGPVDEIHVFQKKCSRLGQKQLFKSTSMQKHTCFYLKCKKQNKKSCRLGEMHILS